MLTCTKLESQIEYYYLEFLSEVVIFDDILEQIATDNYTTVKELKNILYYNKSKYHGTKGFIDGNRISNSNLSITSKRLFKKIFNNIEKSLDYKLDFEEKMKVLEYIECSIDDIEEV